MLFLHMESLSESDFMYCMMSVFSVIYILIGKKKKKKEGAGRKKSGERGEGRRRGMGMGG